jgi:hypothetical protein
MTKLVLVRWSEPDDLGKMQVRTCTVEKAIEHQVQAAAEMCLSYVSRDQALDDFLRIHWTRVEEEERT